MCTGFKFLTWPSRKPLSNSRLSVRHFSTKKVVKVVERNCFITFHTRRINSCPLYCHSLGFRLCVCMCPEFGLLIWPSEQSLSSSRLCLRHFSPKMVVKVRGKNSFITFHPRRVNYCQLDCLNLKLELCVCMCPEFGFLIWPSGKPVTQQDVRKAL